MSAQVFTITDLVKKIGHYKKEFEEAQDIYYLNNNFHFQQLILLIFNNIYDSGLTIKNKNQDDQRLMIKICKHKPILLTFEIFQKYKRIPYYVDQLFLDVKKSALYNQKEISKYILNDSMLLNFFY